MPIIKPIPKHLLRQEVTYEKYVEGDEWNGPQYEEPITLKHVRVQFSTDLNRNNNAENVTFQALMFYDLTHSLPKNVEFVENSRVTVDGREMYVKEIHPMHALKLQHIEVVLV